MKTNGLAQYYDRLKVWERIPLMLAANARGDVAEAQSLFNSSPRRTWRFAEHLMAEQALHVLALIYISEQLDAAAQYFFCLWRLDDPDEFDLDVGHRVAQSHAYFFTANAAAWRHFCADLGVSAEALVAANQHGWFLRYCEEHMPANAPSAATVEAWPREPGQETLRIITADDLLESWRRLLRAINSDC